VNQDKKMNSKPGETTTTPIWIYLGGLAFSWRSKFSRQAIIFLGSNNEQPKKYISLAIFVSRQEKYVFPWLFGRVAKKMESFLGCFGWPPRKICVSLAALLSRQENSEEHMFISYFTF